MCGNARIGCVDASDEGRLAEDYCGKDRTLCNALHCRGARDLRSGSLLDGERYSPGWPGTWWTIICRRRRLNEHPQLASTIKLLHPHAVVSCSLLVLPYFIRTRHM